MSKKTIKNMPNNELRALQRTLEARVYDVERSSISDVITLQIVEQELEHRHVQYTPLFAV